MLKKIYKQCLQHFIQSELTITCW